jgi:hypothetical protein
LQSFEFLDRTQAARGSQLAGNFVFAPLIMSRGAKAARRGAFQFKTFQVTVKGKIEVQPGLLAIGYDIQAGRQLIKKSRDNSVVLHFCAVGFTKLIEMLTGKLQPTRKWVAANHGRAEGVLLHTQLLQKKTKGTKEFWAELFSAAAFTK